MTEQPADERIELVRSGYDAMAGRYLAWSAEIVDDPRERFLGELLRRLPDGSSVVDLGCGAGVPSTRALADEHRVLGVDLSAEQLRMARQNVPAAEFRQADISTLDLEAGAWDAVTALYSLIHVPRERHHALLRGVHRWLRSGGFLLATFSAGGGSDGIQADFLGVPMYFSGHDAATNRDLVAWAGFATVLEEVVTIGEPDGPVMFHWMLARA